MASSSSSDSRFPSSDPDDPPPISVPESFSHDVLLSFSGDSRVTGYLYLRLVGAGIRTFVINVPEVGKGGEISLEFMRAIEESRIYIVVFSENYASSTWCLNELVRIKHQCENDSRRVLLPVFDGVQQSDVRDQKGSFEGAFRLLDLRFFTLPDLVLEWRRALKYVANHSGFTFQTDGVGLDLKVITLIIEKVQSHVNPKKLFVAKHPTSIPESSLYDVFLSFRGKDTRNYFTSHLYKRLVEAGIHTFMNDDELCKGGEISLELMRAMEESRTYVVVFSQTYASSTWCLNELVKILRQCDKNRGRVLLPVYYGVQPSDVRYQKESFEEAFRFHDVKYIDQPYLIETWRNALFRAVDYSGFDWQTSEIGSEASFISLIVKEVLFQVKPKTLYVAKYPVGLDSRVNDVHSLLRLQSDYNVCLIGIWGMGGSGKTIIAKALYNKIHLSFDSSCFLPNVSVRSQQPNGILHLQEYLISELLMRTNVKLSSVDGGMEMIRERLRRKKVLIVLDDTDKLSQIDALAGHRCWFGPGSRIIITTQDQSLLNQVQVDGIYETKELNYEESLELFSWHSFDKQMPDEPYNVIADKIVAYSCGLPLVLEVIGTFLFGKTVQEWNSYFDKIHKIPYREIQDISDKLLGSG